MIRASMSLWMQRASAAVLALVLALASITTPVSTNLAEDNDETELLAKVNMVESVRTVRRLIPAQVHSTEPISPNQVNTDAAVRLPISTPAPFAGTRSSCLRC